MSFFNIELNELDDEEAEENELSYMCTSLFIYIYIYIYILLNMLA